MGRSIAGKIKINSFADLVGGVQDGAVEVPLADLHDFKDHPFRVIDDEKMEETVQSIKEHGVLVPGIARPCSEGGYELISGHRRKHACGLAGLTTMPVLIRKYSDDEAVCIMVDSNIQREDILPSEKARAYRMKYEAMKHQGSKDGGMSLDEIGETAGESGKSVQRYIRLTYLQENLLNMIDKRVLPMMAGVDLSYLRSKEQGWVFKCLNEEKIPISLKQSRQLKKASQEEPLSYGRIREILGSHNHPDKRITLKMDRIMEFFPEDISIQEIEDIIYELLEKRKAEVEA